MTSRWILVAVFPLVGFALAALAALAACSAPRQEPAPTTSNNATPRAAVVPDSEAYFAGGCFWGVEHFLEQMDGVANVESGYMGGHVDDPSYDQVSHTATGHAETVRVRFDSKRITYEAIARRFFEIHDPTQADGQGPDIGDQYRSAVFYASDDQRRVAESLVAQLEARGYAVVTQIAPAGRFWAAEDYHQDYYARTGKQPYCHTPVDRFGTRAGD